MASKRVSKKNLKRFAENLKTNANILKRETSYNVGEIINKGQVVLKCITAGTTDKEALNLIGIALGDTLTDGTAEWEVVSTTGYGFGSGGGTSVSEWATSTSYEAGQIVIYGDSLYRCITDHDSTTFSADEANWQLIFADLKDWATDTYYKVGVVVVKDKSIYRCKIAHTSDVSDFSNDILNWDVIGGGKLEDWQPNRTYESGDLFVYDGQIYKVLVGFTSGITFAEIDILDDYTLASWQANHAYTAGEYFEESGVVYEVLNNFTSGATFVVTSDIAVYTPITWASGINVNVNDLVEDSGNYYIALVNFTCGEEFTKVAFEEYVPKSLTDSQIEDIVNSFNPEFVGIPYTNGVPIGTIINFMGTRAPSDYLICDGTVYNIIDYENLAEYFNDQFGSYNYFGGDGTTTFAVPDLRGEFLRGTGTNSHTGQGDGSSVGSHQDGTDHTALFLNANSTELQAIGWASNSSIYYNTNRDGVGTVGSSTSYTNFRFSSKNGATLGSAGSKSFTSRPTNTSVLYCIKYR